MADKQNSAYGAKSGDTDFRKTWNRDEFSKRARESDIKAKEEARARYEAKAAGKTYRTRAATPEDIRNTEARDSRVDVSSMVGRTTLIAAGAGSGRRGKTGGFYCPECDESYKDSFSYIDHLNSPQHLRQIGQSSNVQVSSLEEVRQRLNWLSRKKREEGRDELVALDERLELAKEREEAERAEKRRKRNEKRRKTPFGLGHPEVKLEDNGVIR